MYTLFTDILGLKSISKNIKNCRETQKNIYFFFAQVETDFVVFGSKNTIKTNSNYGFSSCQVFVEVLGRFVKFFKGSCDFLKINILLLMLHAQS